MINIKAVHLWIVLAELKKDYWHQSKNSVSRLSTAMISNKHAMKEWPGIVLCKQTKMVCIQALESAGKPVRWKIRPGKCQLHDQVWMALPWGIHKMADKRFNHSKQSTYHNADVPHHFSPEWTATTSSGFLLLVKRTKEAGLQGPTGHRQLHYTYNISIAFSLHMTCIIFLVGRQISRVTNQPIIKLTWVFR